MSTRRGLVLLMAGLIAAPALVSTTPVLAASPAATSSPRAGQSAPLTQADKSVCAENYHQDKAQGQVCKTRGNFLKVKLRNGSTVDTHGPDPIKNDYYAARRPATAAAVVRAQNAFNVSPTPQPVACAPAGALRFQAIYAVPTASPNQSATYDPLMQQEIQTANGFVNSEAQVTSSGATGRHLAFACDGGGLPAVINTVLTTPCATSTFSSIDSDLQANGFNNSNTKYWVFFDCNSPQIPYAGQGQLYYDDRANPNYNNQGNMVAIEYNYSGDALWDVALHEASHTMGAVQTTTPNTTGAGHCTDGYDIMCYNDGGPTGNLYGIVCADRTHYDCHYDDYFNTDPASGSYLAQHWNLGGPYNSFLWGPLAIDNLAPAYGPAAGGTQVTLVGAGFLGGPTTVTVGGMPASGVSITSNTSLSFVSPGGAAGSQDVVVTTPHGSSGAKKFFYTPHLLDASSNSQYTLTSSDGATWQPLDAAKLTLNFIPPVNSLAVISANADLFTDAAGYNQDLGIYATPSDVTQFPSNIVAWKESGGFAGTYSPNAAYVQTVLPVTAGTAYTVGLRWKTNLPAPGATIYAGAGPLAGTYSPTRLTVEFLPAQTGLGATVVSTRSTHQYMMSSGDGATWQDIDGANLSVSVTPSANATALISGNADLFTANAGINQDLGVYVNPSDAGTYPAGIVGWKESGGFAGTYSPNAVYVQAAVPLTAGTTYTVKLRWKTNKPAPGTTIYAGAGGGAPYSPTQLTVQLVPQVGSGLASVRSTSQYTLNTSDSLTWSDMDPAGLHLLVPAGPQCTDVVTGNVDLFTATPGINQDVAINPAGAPVTAWKESGGFAGAFSPNAAQVIAVLPLGAGSGSDLRLAWKTNVAVAGQTIYGGAGPVAASYSPTTLISQLVDCLPLSITSAQTLPAAIAGVAYSTQVAAQNGALPYSWSATGLPPGLSITPATGLISGTPTTAGPVRLTVLVQDATGAIASRDYS